MNTRGNETLIMELIYTSATLFLPIMSCHYFTIVYMKTKQEDCTETRRGPQCSNPSPAGSGRTHTKRPLLSLQLHQFFALSFRYSSDTSTRPSQCSQTLPPQRHMPVLKPKKKEICFAIHAT
jgi:hypothetical protein